LAAALAAVDLCVNPDPGESAAAGLSFGPALPNSAAGRMKEGPMQSLFDILLLLLGVAKFFVLAHFIMSWLVNFQVLNIRQPLVAQIWFGLNRLLEPVYAPIRRILPQMGGLDLSPLVVLIGIYALEIVLRNNVGLFV
jgi:YggT family protein